MDVSMIDNPALGLFYDVSFCCMDLPSLEEDPGYQQLIAELQDNGAKYIPVNDSTGRIENLPEVTHIITRTHSFPQYEQVLDQLKHVVKPQWVQVSLAKGKQQNPRQYSPDPALFLNDVVVYCSGIPDGDREAIFGATIALGGLTSEALSKLVTHVVTLSDDDPAAETCRRKGLSAKVILPHWFDDCLRLRRRISEEPYLLPNPEILQKHHDIPPNPRNPKSIDSAITPTPSGGTFTSSLSSSDKEIIAFKDQILMLSSDLNLGRTTKDSLESIITRSGGSVTDDITKADYLICQYRETEDFLRFWKLRDGKNVGNLSWLYHVIVHGKYVNPLLKLLHFPVPRNGVPGFENFKIAISSYTGNVRIYVENVCKITGCRFSKTMAQDNTHLICAHKSSEKADAALEWNINVVNHVWLEDSYAKMKVQALTAACYTHFPLRTNLGEAVGATSIDRSVIDNWMIKKHPNIMNGGQRGLKPQTSAIIDHVAPSAAKHKSVGNGTEDAAGLRKRGRPTGSSTPASRRVVDGKENQSPSTPLTAGSRSAKAKALSKLHDQAADIALFQKEIKRKGGITHGREHRTTGSLGAEHATESKKTSPKRSHDETEESEVDELTAPPGKKVKNGRQAPKLRVMVSMYERWLEHPTHETKDKNILRNLGIHLIEDPAPSGQFVLCAPRLGRTKKFVCALAYGPDVLDTSFLDAALEKKEIPDFEDHLLVDTVNEKKMGLSIQDSLARAHENKHKLLHGWQIFCTEKIPGGYDTYKAIIDANGGSCIAFNKRTKMAIRKRSRNVNVPARNLDDDTNTLYLISGGSSEESNLWEGFRKMAAQAEMEPRIVMLDWILGVAMSQKMVWKDEWLHP